MAQRITDVEQTVANLHLSDSPDPDPATTTTTTTATTAPVVETTKTLVGESQQNEIEAKAIGNPTRRRRRHVHFPDESNGGVLFESRECPSTDVPPDLDVKSILKEDYVEPVPFRGLFFTRSESIDSSNDKWAYSNKEQPIDDYCAFAKTIEKQLISAENVTVSHSKLICTIKVKSTKPVRRVYARITFNNWISFKDVDCSLIPMAGMATSAFVAVLYQRYCFEHVLPPTPKGPVIIGNDIIIFAFCVQFEDGEERWDNNGGSNYTIEIQKGGADVVDDANLVEPIVNGPNPMTGSPSFAFNPSEHLLNIQQERYQSQMRTMSPDYNFYNESSEFYW